MVSTSTLKKLRPSVEAERGPAPLKPKCTHIHAHTCEYAFMHRWNAAICDIKIVRTSTPSFRGEQKVQHRHEVVLILTTHPLPIGVARPQK